MKTTTRSRRLRNAHLQEEKQKEPFFLRSPERESRPFFDARQSGSGQTVQAKLKVGQAGDRYEQEADRAASDVVGAKGRSPELQRQEPDSVQRITLMSPVEDEELGTAEARMEKDKLIQEKIQRKDDRKGDEEELLAKKEEEGTEEKRQEEGVQAKGEGGSFVSPDVSRKMEKSAGGGMPLSGEIRAEMERVFGADFSGVSIHTDAEAVRLNRQLHSQAFTRGQDIFFNEGMYRPETSEGKRLLAHELAHVVQQCGRKSGGERKKQK